MQPINSTQIQTTSIRLENRQDQGATHLFMLTWILQPQTRVSQMANPWPMFFDDLNFEASQTITFLKFHNTTG